MDEAQFWTIIDKARDAAGGDAEEQLEELSEILSTLLPHEIVAFDRLLSQYHAQADSWDLWGAAYVIGGGCSDDGFLDFRGWLISRGEKAYRNALADPESLVHVVRKDEDCRVEGYQYIASQVWKEKTGRSMDEYPTHDIEWPAETLGTPWEEDELEERFPKLSEKFG